MAKKKNAAERSKNPAVKATVKVAKPTASKKAQVTKTPKSRFAKWFAAARVKTLSLAVAPVAFGTGVASANQAVNWVNASLALVVALMLQIGVNYANDYSDGIRGTDSNRVGPFRITASGAVKATTVRNVAFVFFAIAAAAGAALVVLTQIWWLLAVGAVAILAAWFYTGGKKPYGYVGLGELVAFLFFGPVAVYGTAVVQSPFLLKGDTFLILTAAGGAIAIGLLAAAVLLVNNLRDIEGDAAVSKKTLAVRLGATGSKILITVFVVAALGLLVPYPFFYPITMLAYFSALLFAPALGILFTYRTPRELVLALQLVSWGALIFGVLLGFGLSTQYLF